MKKQENGMYALLIAVAAMIGVTIYGSCSADEDYDGCSSKNELFTLADGEMERGGEGQEYHWYFYGTPIDAGGDTITNVAFYGNIHPEIYTYWTMGFTGNWNPTGPQSCLSVQWSGLCINNDLDSMSLEGNHYYIWKGHISDVDEMTCTWETISRIRYHCHYTVSWEKYDEHNNFIGIFLDGRYITFRRTPSFHENDTIRPNSN